MLTFFFQLTRYFMCKICKADIKYTDTKTSGSNIRYFDVNVAFYVYVFFIFAIKSMIKSGVFTFQFAALKVSIIFKIITWKIRRNSHLILLRLLFPEVYILGLDWRSPFNESHLKSWNF